MKRVLVVAYYFPPVAAAGSIRVAGLARHLPEFGWDPHVLAPRKTPHAHAAGVTFPEDKVTRSRSIELSNAGRALGADSSGAERGSAPRAGIASALRAFALRWVYYPDGQPGWYPGAVWAGRRLMREQHFDAVWSSSFPITGHLIARRLARSASIPWVAEFRDPWSDTLAPDSPHRARARRLEQSLAASATALVMPTQTWAELYGARWGKPIHVVPNAFDEPALGSAELDRDRPVITHLGSYYPGRQDYSALWRALAEVPEARLRIVGDLNGGMATELAAAGVGDRIDATGYVQHDKVGQLLESSSLLVAAAFSEDDPVANGVIPAKVFDYLATTRPILYLSRPGTEGARLLEGQDGCFVVDPQDTAAVTDAVRRALAHPVAQRDPQQWGRRAAAVKLAALLDEISA